MMRLLARISPPFLVGAVLIAVTALTLKPYDFNPTAIFHLDKTLSSVHELPKGFVVLSVPAYDGAGYYQIARSIPKIANPDRWAGLAALPPSAYAYQRFLLPLLAWTISWGQENALPWAFLFIHIASLIGASAFLLRATGKPLFALAVGLCPAAMVGLHFSVAEPLTLLLLCAFLARYLRNEEIDAFGIVLLCALVLTREVNILFAGLLGVYSLCRGRWADCVRCLAPLAAFLALHTLIYKIFGDLPFLESTGKRDFPGHALFELLIGRVGYDVYTLSSIALFLGFVLPGTLWVLRENVRMIRTKAYAFLPIGALAFFLLMLNMPDHIWSSITSIGRVITPVYPLFLFLAADEDTVIARILAVSTIVLGLVTGVGMALIAHPYTLA